MTEKNSPEKLVSPKEAATIVQRTLKMRYPTANLEQILNEAHLEEYISTLQKMSDAELRRERLQFSHLRISRMDNRPITPGYYGADLPKTQEALLAKIAKAESVENELVRRRLVAPF